MSASTENARPAPISLDEIEEIRSKIVQAVASGLTIRTIADESGVPYGTLSAFVKGTYTGRNDNTAERLRPWLSSQEAKERTKRGLVLSPSFILTPSASTFIDTLEFAQHTSDIVLITGAPGIGKTMAAKTYAESSPNVWLLTADPMTRTSRQILLELADACGLVLKGRNHAARLATSLYDRLEGTSGLIIVDEAQNLLTEAIDQLRAFYDRAGIGVALIGNDTVKSRLEGANRSADYAQLFSRVGMRVNKKAPTKKDVALILDAWKLTDENVRRRAEEIAREPGALRGLNKALRIAHVAAANEGKPTPTEKQLSTAWGRISGWKGAS